MIAPNLVCCDNHNRNVWTRHNAENILQYLRAVQVDGRVQASLWQIAVDLGISTQTVHKHMRRLEKAGAISVTRYTNGPPNLYEVH